MGNSKLEIGKYTTPLKLAFAIIAIALLAAGAFAQFAPRSFQIAGARRSLLDDTPPEPRLVSNVIIDIKPETLDTLWLGTGNGLTRVIVRSDSVRASHFDAYTQAQGMGKGGASGLLVTDSIIWASFAFDTSVITAQPGLMSHSRVIPAPGTWIPIPDWTALSAITRPPPMWTTSPMTSP